MGDINVSIVLYNTELKTAERAIKSLLNTRIDIKIYLIDNSKVERLEVLKGLNPKQIEYIFTNRNLGYGKANNIVLNMSLKEGVKYHLVMNPDVYFENGVLEELYDFMEKNPDVGLVMPKVLNEDGSIQYICRLLPTPIDLIVRRFLYFGPFKNYMEKKNYVYELRFTGYDRIMEAPFLSGCFMFIRTSILEKVGFFDERFFLYMEDTDLSRRIHRVSKTVFYPYVAIYHKYNRGSYRNFRLLFHHIISAVKYFNKWGWFKDSERDRINSETLNKLGFLK
jgi:GT2 family glycosyltransferase